MLNELLVGLPHRARVLPPHPCDGCRPFRLSENPLGLRRRLENQRRLERRSRLSSTERRLGQQLRAEGRPEERLVSQLPRNCRSCFRVLDRLVEPRAPAKELGRRSLARSSSEQTIMAGLFGCLQEEIRRHV